MQEADRHRQQASKQARKLHVTTVVVNGVLQLHDCAVQAEAHSHSLAKQRPDVNLDSVRLCGRAPRQRLSSGLGDFTQERDGRLHWCLQPRRHFMCAVRQQQENSRSKTHPSSGTSNCHTPGAPISLTRKRVPGTTFSSSPSSVPPPPGHRRRAVGSQPSSAATYEVTSAPQVDWNTGSLTLLPSGRSIVTCELRANS